MTRENTQELASDEFLHTSHELIEYLIELYNDLKKIYAEKAGFDPNQPRDKIGRWTDSGYAQPSHQLANTTRPSEESPYQIDLHEEEANGGHTIARHVGMNEETLKNYVYKTIQSNPNSEKLSIRSGSFSSVVSANKLVNATLARNNSVVKAIALGIIRETRVDAYFSSITGIEAYALNTRSQIRIRPTYGVGVFIRHDPKSPRGFKVITAYPRNID